ncbi:MAG: hypothetical protein WC506_02065 [Candidatus Micrarchaeia archaeon]
MSNGSLTSENAPYAKTSKGPSAIGKTIKYFFARGESKNLLANKLIEIHLERARAAAKMLNSAGAASEATKALKYLKPESEIVPELVAKEELYSIRALAYSNLASSCLEMAVVVEKAAYKPADLNVREFVLPSEVMTAGSAMKYAYLSKPETVFKQNALDFLKKVGSDYKKLGNTRVALGKHLDAHDAYAMGSSAYEKAAGLEPNPVEKKLLRLASESMLKLASDSINRRLY